MLETAGAFLSNHPYLAVDLIGVPGFLVLFALSTGSRWTVVAAGLVLVPFAPLATLHNGAYWRPDRLQSFTFGIEDTIYLFLSGSVAWAFAALFSKTLPRVEAVRWRRSVRRLAVLIVAGIGMLALASAIMTDVFAASVSILALLVVTLSVIRPARIEAASAAALGYTTYHLANLLVGFALWPHFRSAWPANAFWSAPVATLPLGEMVFSPLVAAAHVMALAWILEPAGDGAKGAD
jgi:hypothetical protein